MFIKEGDGSPNIVREELNSLEIRREPQSCNGKWLWARPTIKSCSAPGSLDTSLSHAAGLIEIAACHA